MQNIENMSFISKTPEPPYFAVIFTSAQSQDLEGYSEQAIRMEELARQQNGFLGLETARDGSDGITVSYWSSLEAINAWRLNLEHLDAQTQGKKKWYQHYRVRIAKVEREYGK